MARKGPSHDYDYNLQNLAGNVPPLTFAKAHERPSPCYDYNPYCSVTNIPPLTFGPQATTCNGLEEEFQWQLEEATIQSQNDYMQKLEEDNYFLNMQWDVIYQLYPGLPFGPGEPSLQFDDTNSDLDWLVVDIARVV
jgi:hypothetical protein